MGLEMLLLFSVAIALSPSQICGQMYLQVKRC